MEIPKELEMEIVNKLTTIKSVDVTYKNGETVSGFVTKVKFMPFDITLCKHETKKGEKSNVHLDFTKIKEITLVYHNSEKTKTFKDN